MLVVLQALADIQLHRAAVFSSGSPFQDVLCNFYAPYQQTLQLQPPEQRHFHVHRRVTAADIFALQCAVACIVTIKRYSATLCCK
jgi:hypothetical protein